MAELAYISQITLPSGTTYHIKDTEAREKIAEIFQDLTGALVFVGISDTAITDGATTNPITVGGVEHTAEVGDVVINGQKEFVFTSSNKWVELGDFGDLQSQLGDLAYLNSASGSYTPAGNITIIPENYSVTSTGTAEIDGDISQPTFTGKENQVIEVEGSVPVVNSITATFAGTEGDVSVSGSVTASGTVSKPDFRGTAATITTSGLYKPEGEITATPITANETVTSTGSINQITGVNSTFTGTSAIVSVSGSCVPSGTVSTPDVDVKATSSSEICWTGTVTDEILTFSAATITYVTGVTANLAEAPVFTGKDTAVAASGSFQPGGTIANTYSATATSVSVTGTVQKVTGVGATFEGTETTVSLTGTYTPTGEVTQPTFSGTPVSVNAAGKFTPAGNVTPTFTTTAQSITASGVFTAEGTVSTPTFTGTKAALTVTGTVPTAKSATFAGTAATITVSKPAVSA